MVGSVEARKRMRNLRGYGTEVSAGDGSSHADDDVHIAVYGCQYYVHHGPNQYKFLGVEYLQGAVAWGGRKI
jgi:hypothetical protein